MTFNIFRIFGLAGTILIILAIVIRSLRYRGKRGEHFSLFNHFISELGEVGISPAAWVFNGGMMIGGVILLPYILELGLIFRSALGWLGTAAGIVATLGVIAVGIFPMNNLHAHGIAAVTYFRAGLVMVFFFGLAILFQPGAHKVIPQAANLFSLLAFLSYASFLILMTPKKSDEAPADALDPEQVPERPRVWLLAVIEWVVFFTTILWFFGMTFMI